MVVQLSLDTLSRSVKQLKRPGIPLLRILRLLCTRLKASVRESLTSSMSELLTSSALEPVARLRDQLKPLKFLE